MELRFWEDPETGLPHIYVHDVTEAEVQQVLDRPGLDYPEAQDAAFAWEQRLLGAISRWFTFPTRGPGVPLSSALINCAAKPSKHFAARKGERRDEKATLAAWLD
jgi:hypothetical protein